MPILASDFAALTDDLQKIFSETAKKKIADNKGFSIFNVYDTDRLSYDYQVLHGISGIKRLTSGQDLPRIDGEEGDNASWTQEYFGGIVGVTKKMRKFDMYGKIEGIVKSVTEDAFDKVDQSLADTLVGGWATTHEDPYGDTVTSVGPNGLALFSASQSTPLNSNTFSNIITDGTNTNPPLSREAIVYWRAQGKKHKDPNNLSRPINYDTLIVGPELEDEADRICNSEYLPGTNNNDRNPLKGKIKNIYVWERLAAASDGTDSDAYWFMADSDGMSESLQCLFSERPSLDAPDQVYTNKNWDYSLDFFYAIGLGFQAYVSGSKGDKS
jgi:hypothetical protein